MEKELLIGQLEHTKNNYIMGLAAYSLFESGRVNQLLESHSAAFGEYIVTFDQIAKLLREPKDKEIALKEFLKMLMRTLIKESFEHIKDYCQLTDQYAALKGETWYEFGRLIRNFLSHNCRFEFNKYDRDRLPVTWKDKSITQEMDRKDLEMSFFGYVETWELFLEFEDLVDKRLK